jgi:hypothetical protein
MTDFNQKRFRLVITLKEIMWIIIIICLSIIIFYVFYYRLITINFVHDIKKGKYITIYLNEKPYIEGMLYTFMISLLLLAFFQSLGLNILKADLKTRIFLVFYFVYLFSLGFITVGLGIEFSELVEFDLFKLQYRKFESNSVKGLKFYIINFYPLLLFFYIISFPFDSRKKKE